MHSGFWRQSLEKHSLRDFEREGRMDGEEEEDAFKMSMLFSVMHATQWETYREKLQCLFQAYIPHYNHGTHDLSPLSCPHLVLWKYCLFCCRQKHAQGCCCGVTSGNRDTRAESKRVDGYLNLEFGELESRIRRQTCIVIRAVCAQCNTRNLVLDPMDMHKSHVSLPFMVHWDFSCTLEFFLHSTIGL